MLGSRTRGVLRKTDTVPYTLVSFHAHPDDEALLTAGTLARASAEGHRVVLVVATTGEAGLAASDVLADGPLGERRTAELMRSARALGCARVEWLGYADSGMADAPSGAADSFADADLEEAAERLAAILREEEADAITIYDPAGGYGHPDHVQVHHVGDRKSTRLNSSHLVISYAVFCLKKKTIYLTILIAIGARTLSTLTDRFRITLLVQIAACVFSPHPPYTLSASVPTLIGLVAVTGT